MIASSYDGIERERLADTLVEIGVPAAAAARLLDAHPRLRGLGASTAADIAAAAGVRGEPAWSRRVAAAFKLVRTADAARDGYRSIVRAPSACAAYLRTVLPRLCDEQREHFGVILLDARGGVQSCHVVAVGSLAQVDIHPREVFAVALRNRAHSVLLFHNHPSGDPDPSDADADITRRLVDVGRTIGIPVLDHVIVAGAQSYSFAAAGAMP